MKMRFKDEFPVNRVRLGARMRLRRIPWTKVDLPVPGRLLNLPTWLRYVLATALVAATFATRMIIVGNNSAVPFLLSFPCIMICGYVFEHATAYYALLLSTIYVMLFILAHDGSYMTFRGLDMIGLVMFIISGAASAYMIERLHDTMLDLLQANDKLVAVNIALAHEQDRSGILLREATHRMRNDLQRFAATLAMQRSATRFPHVKAALGEAEARIVAMASLNGRLDHVYMINNHKQVDSHVFLAGLMEDLLQSTAGRSITVQVEAESHPLSVPLAVAMGQIISELATNAMKYAFPDGRDGVVSATFRHEGDSFVLVVSDNGVGYDQDAPPQGTGLGKRLILSLTKHVRGKIEIVSSPGGGTTCTLRLPAIEAAPLYATG